MATTRNAHSSATPRPQELQDQLNERAEAFSKNFADAGPVVQKPAQEKACSTVLGAPKILTR